MGQLTDVDAHPHQLRGLDGQSLGRRWVLLIGQIVGHRCPYGDHVDAGIAQRVIEDAHDARGAFVSGGKEPVKGEGVRPGRRAHQRHGESVGHLSDEGAHGDRSLDAERLQRVDQLLDECLPAVMGLFAENHHEIPFPATDGVQLIARPRDVSRPRGIDLHERTPHLEVEVFVGVHGGDHMAVQVLQEGRGGLTGRLTCVAPALERHQRDRVVQEWPLEPLQRCHDINLHLITSHATPDPSSGIVSVARRSTPPRPRRTPSPLPRSSGSTGRGQPGVSPPCCTRKPRTGFA